VSVNVAIIGGGTISEQHLSAASGSPRATLVAVCDLDESRAGRMAEDYDVPYYLDVEQLLASEDLDVVHVCTPVQTHFSLAESAIAAGVAVIVEKPATETLAELDDLQELSDAHEVPVSVIHQHQFSPAMRQARALVEDGQIGTVRGADLIYTGFSRPDTENRGEWTFDLPGGEFEEGLPHPIYLGLNGGYPRSETDVTAITSLMREYDREFSYDAAQVQFVTETGGLSNFKILSGGHATRMLFVHGETGTVTVDFVSQTVLHGTHDYFGSPIDRARKNIDESVARLSRLVEMGGSLAMEKVSGDWNREKELDPHKYQIDEMYRVVEEGGEVPVSLEEARWTITLMEQIRDAAESTVASRTPSH
jgi:predicted dehydrogenase